MVKGFAGIGLTLTGIGLVAGGIPTWIVGVVRKKRIKIQLVKFNSPGSASITGVGLKIIF
jgi:hypothetical protein